MADGAGSASGLEEKLAGLSTGGGGGDKQNPPPAGEGGEEPQLSKNAKKREEKRKKLEEERRLKEEEKKNKAAAAAAACGTTQRASAADDDDMDPTQYYENRLKTLDSLKTAGVNPYPHKFPVGISVAEYIEKYKSLSDGEKLDVTECLAGRIMNKRTSSSKLFFYDLYGGGMKVQVMADARTSELDEAEFTKYHSGVKRGDIVGICGYPGKSKRGELSVFPQKFVVLSPCLHMMPRQKGEGSAAPASWTPGMGRNIENYVLRDQETRYRQRYLDLMVNHEVRHIFKTRSKVVSFIRKFLDDREFLEVETPMMNMIAGGAAARPFVTHHNELNMRLFMRIAPGPTPPPPRVQKQKKKGNRNREPSRKKKARRSPLSHRPRAQIRMTGSMDLPAKGGFSYELCRRNDFLEKKGLKIPGFLKTGTTIVGLVFQDGVVLGADTRATEGPIVADKNCEKIHFMAPNIYCCGAGTAADTEAVTDMVSSQLQLHRYATGRESRVVTALTLLKSHLFKYQGHVSAALVLGGVDCTGPHLHTVYPHGSTDTLPFATMGSGSLAAMSVFESKYKEGLTREEGIQLVTDAIRGGIFNDLGSGSNVDVCVITKGKTEYLRNHELPNPRTYVSSKGYSFTKGQTEVLSTKITQLKQKVEVAEGGDAMEE